MAEESHAQILVLHTKVFQKRLYTEVPNVYVHAESSPTRMYLMQFFFKGLVTVYMHV